MSEQELSIALRIIIRFFDQECVKLAENLRRSTKQFKEDTLSRNRLFVWHKQFVESRDHAENERYDSQTCTSITNNILCVQQLHQSVKRSTVIEIANEVSVSYGSTFFIITDE